MSLLTRKTADAPAGKGLLTDYMAQPSVAPVVSASNPTLGVSTLIVDIAGNGIASAESFGSQTVTATTQLVGIASAEVFGRPAVGDNISAVGIASAEAFGLPIVSVVPSETTRTQGGGRPNVWYLRRKRKDEEEAMLISMMSML